MAHQDCRDGQGRAPPGTPPLPARTQRLFGKAGGAPGGYGRDLFPGHRGAHEPLSATPGTARTGMASATTATITVTTPGTGFPGAVCLRGCCRVRPHRHRRPRSATDATGLPPPALPSCHQPHGAATGLWHGDKGYMIQGTVGSIVLVLAGMVTLAGTVALASPGETQPEAPAWHGGSWPPA